MNNMIFSILLIIIGLIVGFGISFIINLLRGNIASKKAESIINQAKKDADKIKRDSILEQKEESHRLKMDLDKEIKEKRLRLRNKKKECYNVRVVWISVMNYIKSVNKL